MSTHGLTSFLSRLTDVGLKIWYKMKEICHIFHCILINFQSKNDVWKDRLLCALRCWCCVGYGCSRTSSVFRVTVLSNLKFHYVLAKCYHVLEAEDVESAQTKTFGDIVSSAKYHPVSWKKLVSISKTTFYFSEILNNHNSRMNTKSSTRTLTVFSFTQSSSRWPSPRRSKSLLILKIVSFHFPIC